MAKRPPVESKPTKLPFEDSNFKWETFEAFFCQFLEAQPIIEGRQIKSARRYGVQGGKQEGIDLLATVEGPSGTEEWTFQCKHVKKWAKADTDRAMKKHTYPGATRRFLLITSAVNEKARKPLEGQSEWRLWDGRQISGEFFRLKSEREAALIAYRCFGEACAKDWFQTSGRGSFLTPDALFLLSQGTNNLILHDQPLVGRTEQLRELDAFVKDQETRLLILPGRGGMGKSRLLKEWTGQWRKRFSQGACWIAWGESTGLATQIEELGDYPVIVLEDAHLHPELRDGLLSAIAQVSSAKLVCSTRTGGEEEIVQKAQDHHLDRNQIQLLKPLPSLSAHEAMDLATLFLGPGLAVHAPSWITLVQDCPVFAHIAASELRQRGGHAFEQVDNKQIRDTVFARLDRHLPADLKQSGLPVLKALALLGPIREPADFLSFWSKHTGKPQSELDGVLDQLGRAGLVERCTRALHIVPEIYGDYLAKNAVFNSTGGDTGFLGEVMGTLGEALFEVQQPWLCNLARNLAQAQWLMNRKDPSSPDLFARVLERVKSRVNSMPKLEQMKLLDQWVAVAPAQAAASLDLVRHVWNSGATQAESKDWETPQILRATIQVILAAAQHNPPQVGGTLDLLWWLHRHPSVETARCEQRAIDAMAKLSTLGLLQPGEVSLQALAWFENWVRKECAPQSDRKAGWLLVTLAQPFLKRTLEDRHDIGMTVQFREKRVAVTLARKWHEGVLRACDVLLQSEREAFVQALLQIAQKGSYPLGTRLGEQTVPANARAEWVALRLPFITLYETIAKRFHTPMVRAQVRREFRRRKIQFEDEEILAEMHRIDVALPHTIEDDICRVVLEDTDEEAVGPAGTGPSQVEEAIGRDVPTRVARRVLDQGWSPEHALAVFHDLLQDSNVPEFRHNGLPDLTRSLILQRPGWRAPALEWILAHPDSPVLPAFCSVLLQVPAGDWQALSPWLDQALASPVDRLRAEGIRACERAERGWNQPSPASLREDIRHAISLAGPLTLGTAAWWLSARTLAGHLDSEFWAKLPLPPEVSHAPSLLADALERRLDRLDRGQVEKVWRDLLTKVVSWPEPPRGILRDEVPGLHEAFPNVFLKFLLARAEYALMNPEQMDYTLLLVGEPNVPFPTTLELKNVPSQRWQRVVDAALGSTPVPAAVEQWVSLLWLRGTINGAPLDRAILERVQTCDQMARLRFLQKFWPDEPALMTPSKVREVLRKAEWLGKECLEDTRRDTLVMLSPPPTSKGEYRQFLEHEAQRNAGDPLLGPLFREALSAHDASLKQESRK